jgi:D-alanyl-D-alanine carboxypeptidase (penicillin-binding protein 5/6)
MKQLSLKKILILMVFIIFIALIVFLVAHKTTNTSEANINTTIMTSSSLPQKKLPSQATPVFDVTLESNIVLIGNLKTGNIVFQKNADQQTNAASITKLLSSAIILENIDVNDVVSIDQQGYELLPSKTDLVLNERIKVIDLLKMALIMSSNDAISALANHFGYYEFLNQMNQKAKAIGMYSSHFDNPIGFDSENNYSTALDLFQLGKYIYNNFPLIGEITRSQAITITSLSNVKHLVVPTNLIIDKLENY